MGNCCGGGFKNRKRAKYLGSDSTDFAETSVPVQTTATPGHAAPQQPSTAKVQPSAEDDKDLCSGTDNAQRITPHIPAQPLDEDGQLPIVISAAGNTPRPRFQLAKPRCLEDKELCSSAGNAEWGWFSTQGRNERPNEDFVNVLVNEESRIYGVYDGHGQGQCAFTMQSLLPCCVMRSAAFSAGDMSGALEQGYHLADQQWLADTLGADKSGTTATLMIQANNILSIAHVGDSRAVMCVDGKAVQLTADHHASAPKERVRIETLGGTISEPSGTDDTCRVNGQLEVTRSLGDAELKAVVKADPDILIHTVGVQDQFVIIASDGLWDKVSNQAAVNFVRRMTDAKAMASKLVHEAWKAHSQDHIAVIVLRLNCELAATLLEASGSVTDV